MDLTKLTDIKELKAMAYDQLVNKQLAEQNLAAINQRIEQLMSEEKEKPDGKTRSS